LRGSYSRAAAGRPIGAPRGRGEPRTGADYLIAGTVFSSPSKPDSVELIGIDAVRDRPRHNGSVLAIGGITPDRIAAVLEAGAAGIAAIGLFVDSRKRLPNIVAGCL
jgi:thiamine monophosphate synthase